MSKKTKGNYWGYKQSFRIEARSWVEAGDKIRRMKEIAEKKEYVEK